MLFINLIISGQIALTGFFIYRVQRFLRTHRTWELCFMLTTLAFLTAVAIRSDGASGIRRWLPAVLVAFTSLLALEPELVNLWNRLAQSFNQNSLDRKTNALREIARAANALAATKTGALIAFERNDSLLKFGDTGIEINADIKKELLTTLFTKDTPTHDGGALIRKGRISHCSAVFPLSERRQIEEGLGTRHRAAIGLTEKTDAVCLVVSEEEGTISLAHDGELIYSVPPQQLEKKLRKLLSGAVRPRYYPLHYLKQFAPKLVQTNFIQFSKSPSQTIYDFVVVIFWLIVLCLWKSYGTLHRPDFGQTLTTFLYAPWQYVPLILFGLNLFTLLLNHTLTVNGVTNQVKREERFLFLTIVQRKFSLADLKAIILKREHSERNLWSLALLTRKQKTSLIDRSTSAKALADSAKKIRDILRIELVS